ncbi:MAG: efflux RND transporter permease subunit, partial [Pseudomonadota bacterium]
MKRRFRTGGLAAWSIRRPIGVTMLALTVVVLGLLSLQRLGVDLLPHLIYPEIRARILDPGVPATIMEDAVTRQLEEQMAITEGATDVQSTTREGRSQVNLSFPYGTDIDIALRDASTRLDRAKRFLPDTIDPPIIYKRDPSQLPVLEFVVSSSHLEPVRLRDWVDYEFSKWFLNVPGVAAAEVAGAPLREIQVIVDQGRLAGFGLTLADLEQTLARENIEAPGGRIVTGGREYSTKSAGRLLQFSEIRDLPLRRVRLEQDEQVVRLRDVAKVIDHHEDDLLRVRLNGVPGVKLTIQRQPEANTVEVVDAVMAQLHWLDEQQLLPAHITVNRVGDQSVYVRHSLRNASLAALSGALLAMLVVYMFLGSLRRTLIIGLAIPLAILVTFTLMDAGGLTLNIMTLGGLALGVGMLVDNTIVMMENISRHQRLGEGTLDAPINAAAEVNSAIVAATSTNLAAVLPFLFVVGLVGLLFRELIYTLSAAIVSSLLVALTLVPAYSARVHDSKQSRFRDAVDRVIAWLGERYGRFVARFIVPKPWTPLVVFVPLLAISLQVFFVGKQVF